MARTFQTPQLDTWEAFASTGLSGFPEPAWIVFRCKSTRSRSSRYTVCRGDKSDAEQAIRTMLDDELRALFGRSKPLD